VTLGGGLGIEEIVAPHRDEILRVARHHGVKSVWIFGSVRRRQATKSSDVDLMDRWSRSHSLFDRWSLANEIGRILRRRVDVVNEGGMHWAIEPQVEFERVLL
jgi:uncharacterized protein